VADLRKRGADDRPPPLSGPGGTKFMKFNPLAQGSQNSYTIIQGFDAGLAKRPFLGRLF